MSESRSRGEIREGKILDDKSDSFLSFKEHIGES